MIHGLLKELTYPTQKAVLQYLEVNKRIKLSILAPALSFMDRMIPIQIDRLTLDNNITQINDTTYSIGIYREYPDDTIPPYLHQKDNDSGGVDFDLDQWGFRYRFSDELVYPGDLRLNGAVDSVEEENDEERMEALETLRRYYQTSIDTGSVDNHTVKNLEWTKTELLPFHCKRSNMAPNFIPYLQCTINSPEKKETWFLQYSQSIYHAIKSLRSMIFGTRDVVNVRVLVIGMRRKVLRLPESVKFKTEEIRIAGALSTTSEDLAPMIDRSSYPLKVLEAHILRQEDLEHPDLLSAKLLVISNKIRNAFVIENLCNVKHTDVHLTNDIFPVDKYLELIRNWVHIGRPIGSRVSFGFSDETKMVAMIHSVRTSFRTKLENDITLVLPMKGSTTLNITYECRDQNITKYIVFFNVV